MKPPTQRHKFQLELSTLESHKLQLLHNRLRLTRADLIRSAIHALYAHTFDELPHCVDGAKCRCPTLWPARGTQPPPSEPNLPGSNSATHS